MFIVFGKSVRGYSHIRKGKECQDSYKAKYLADGSMIVAVADGHGSDSCPYSKSGSKMAVNSFCFIIESLWDMVGQNNKSLKDYFCREHEVQIPKLIEREWKRRVLKSHSNSKREIPLIEGKKDKQAIYRRYGTTLLGIFVCSEFLFAIQIGDGNIIVQEKNSIKELICGDKFLGTETHSLCEERAWENAYSLVSNIDFENILLSTDGFYNSFVNSFEYDKACKGYFDLIKEFGVAPMQRKLGKWLFETSFYGSGDDITLAFVIKDNLNDNREQ